jgi:DNA-binding beta-propeller fold protein YncE
MSFTKSLTVASIAMLTGAAPASAEILALINYESKPAEALAAYQNQVPGMTRQEGLAVIDVDPSSPDFGKVMRTIELPPDLVAHHIFYNRDQTKAYVTALGRGNELRVIDMTDPALPMTVLKTEGCALGEDVEFSDDDSTWYLTCMGSGIVIVGDAATGAVIRSIDLPRPYPHGIALHEGIDRLLTTNTVRGSDLGDAGEELSIVKASTGEALGTLKVSDKPSPAGEAPVEILFMPGSNPPLAYVTNMYGGTLWAVTWNPATSNFDAAKAFDFAEVQAGVPLEMYFDDAATRLYVTTAKPGHVHVFDVTGDAGKPRLLQSIPTAEGAHHVAFTKDMKLGFVQNSLLNLPGLSDGSVTVVDFEKGAAVASMDTLKNDGFNPNSIVLLPQWNHAAGH